MFADCCRNTTVASLSAKIEELEAMLTKLRKTRADLMTELLRQDLASRLIKPGVQITGVYMRGKLHVADFMGVSTLPDKQDIPRACAVVMLKYKNGGQEKKNIFDPDALDKLEVL